MKTLYVNGDSHSHHVYGAPGKSFAEQLAEQFSANLINQALPGGSNQRIIRTSINDLEFLDPADTFVLIGWSSFERAEWFYEHEWHNVVDSSAYRLPTSLNDIGQKHLNNFNNNMSYCLNCHLEQHQSIWNFHNRLKAQGYRFLFFQACETFFFDGLPEQDKNFCLPWHPNTWAHKPYVTVNSNDSRHIESFGHLCQQQGFKYADDYQHYGQDAHNYWADFLTPKIQTLLN